MTSVDADMDDADIEDDTLKSLRTEVRDLIEGEELPERYPLRKHEIHRALYALTGEKLSNPGLPELRHELLTELQTLAVAHDEIASCEPREYDYIQVFSKDELVSLRDALRHSAEDTQEGGSDE